MTDFSKDKFRGALVGLAVGDALGVPLEFKRWDPATPNRITTMQGGGPFVLPVGEWTDDTSMALCLAKSLIETGSNDAHDQLERYVEWYRMGYMSTQGRCFDIGITTSNALHRFIRNNSVVADGLPGTPSNGSIMRLAPIPMAYAYSVNIAARESVRSSQTTHNNPAARYGCGLLGEMIARALQGVSKADILKPNDRTLNDVFWSSELLFKVQTEVAGTDKTMRSEIAAQLRRMASVESLTFIGKTPPEIKAAGAVWSTLEAALWAFEQTDTFKDGALLAVNLADDSDTVGAVYGQIAGAFYGFEAIPQEWRDVVAWRDQIVEMADMLYDGCVARRFGVSA